MSALLMGLVWGIELSHQEQAVMLALADHAYDDGTKIYPSVARLAWKTGYTCRNVQFVLRRLESKSLIIAVAHQHGGRGKATEYIMKLENGTAKAPFVPEKGEKYDIEKGEKYDIEKGEKYDNSEKGEKYDTQRVKSTTQRVKSETQKGEKGFTPTIIETSENHHENHHAHVRVREALEIENENEPEPEADTPRRPMAFPAFKIAYCEQEGYTPGQVKTSKLMAAYTRYRASFDADVTTREEANSND